MVLVDRPARSPAAPRSKVVSSQNRGSTLPAWKSYSSHQTQAGCLCLRLVLDTLTPEETRQRHTARVPPVWPATAGPGHLYTPAAHTATRAFRRTGRYAPDP